MPAEQDVKDAESQFFTALLNADADALKSLLTDDFQLVDVMGGSVIPGAALIDVIGSKQLAFDKIDHLEANVRLYGDAAVVVGRTLMAMRFGEQAGETKSRYTHVFVKQEGTWRFASAQGTQILE